MRLGVRGHDIPAESPEELCRKLAALDIHEIQLVAHKSFPDFQYHEANIQRLANIFAEHRIHVAVYGCYIDPLTPEGEKRFLTHIQYAKILNAGVIATESAVGATQQQENEEAYQRLVDVFRRFTEEGRRAGVRVAVETVHAHPICDPKKTKRLLDDVGADNLFVILDPRNLLQDENDASMRNRTEEAIRLYGDRIAAVHWKDSSAAKDDPAVRFAAEHTETALITEGLTGELLADVLCTFKEDKA